MSPWIDKDKVRAGIREEVADVRTPDDPDLRYVIPPSLCATMGCGHSATHEAAIYDGVSDEPVWALYCDECAGVLQRGGDDVRRLPRAPADYLNDAIETLGGRLRTVEAERDRMAEALRQIEFAPHVTPQIAAWARRALP
jgi:hypothetical protein